MVIKKKEETKENEVETQDSKILDENKDLKDKLAKMEELLNKLAGQINTNEEPKEKNIETQKEADEISPHTLVKVVSLVNGTLVLQGSNAQPYRFKKYGEPKTINFDEVRSMYYNNTKSFDQGSIYIIDEKVVNALDLTSTYENILDKNKLDNFFKLDKSEIETLFNRASKSQKETIIETVINEYSKNNSAYMNLNKINLLTTLTGRNILEMATQRAQQT